MVKFKDVKKSEEADLVKNRVVYEVTEYRVNHPLYGEVVNWRGTTETEFYSVIFIKGILTVSIDEREMRLGNSSLNVGISEKLVEMMGAHDDAASDVAAALKYNTEVWPKEFAEVSFTDIMVALNWKYAPDAKIFYDEGF